MLKTVERSTELYVLENRVRSGIASTEEIAERNKRVEALKNSGRQYASKTEVGRSGK